LEDSHPKSDYDVFFDKKYPGKKYRPEGVSELTWRAKPFEYPVEDHLTSWVGNRTVEYINKFDFAGKKPMFLKSSFFAPHTPYDCPKKYLDMVDESKMVRRHVGAPWDQVYKNATSERCVGGRYSEAAPACGDRPEAEVNMTRKAYLGAVKHVDDEVGKVIKALKKKGVWDNTVVMFVVDHGDN
jgi:arylsulfatase A-like enzyme